MTEQNHSITPYKPMALAPKPKLAFFKRREDYPVVLNESGEERIVVPLKDYRRFRGDASYWQFLFLLSFVAFFALSLMAYFQPPIYVDKPIIVEKEKPVVVPSKCLIFCK